MDRFLVSDWVILRSGHEVQVSESAGLGCVEMKTEKFLDLAPRMFLRSDMGLGFPSPEQTVAKKRQPGLATEGGAGGLNQVPSTWVGEKGTLLHLPVLLHPLYGFLGILLAVIVPVIFSDNKEDLSLSFFHGHNAILILFCLRVPHELRDTNNASVYYLHTIQPVWNWWDAEIPIVHFISMNSVGPIDANCSSDLGQERCHGQRNLSPFAYRQYTNAWTGNLKETQRCVC